MTEAADNIEKIEPDAASEPEVIVEDAPKQAVAAEEGIESLKKQLEAEKARREAAERQAKESAAAVHKAKAEVDGTNLQLISNAIETVKHNTAALRADYAKAMASGDYDRAADIQLEMSSSAAKLLQLENGRQAMEEKAKTPPPAADPVEALARQLTPRSAAWVRAHPECATDPRLYRKMLAAHNMTEADGIQPDSDDYFAAVESYLGFNKQENRRTEQEDEDDGTEMAAKAVSRRSSPAAAPVSRSVPSSTSNPRVIRLTAEERDIARMNKMTDKEYWEQKQRISRERNYN